MWPNPTGESKLKAKGHGGLKAGAGTTRPRGAAFWHEIGIFLPQKELPASPTASATAINGLASQHVPGGRPSKYVLRSNKYALRSNGSTCRSPEIGDPPGASARPWLHLEECRSSSPGSAFRELIRETALRVGVEPRTLAVRVLLQLPRIASHKGWIARGQARRELIISAERLRNDARAVRALVPVEEFPLRDLTFEVIDPSRALPVLSSLHYLRSVRSDSLYFALVDPIAKLPVTICSLSPLQWNCVGGQLRRQFGIPRERALDLSRVYSVDSSPPNAISSLLSRTRNFVRHNMPDIDLLVTAVDPNLGFTGCSYRASNWQQWMTVKARPYLYENGRYVSPRQLRERYGSAKFLELQTKYPGRFQRSRVRLLDSMIFCCSINGGTEVVPDQDRPRLRRQPERVVD